jgi:hypothetical protein
MRAFFIALILSSACFFTTGVPQVRAQSDSERAWVSAIKQKIVEHVCQDGGKWVECYDQRASDCPRIVREFAYPCIDKASKGAPEQISMATAADLSKSMVECFNKTFQTNYGAWQKNSPECLQPPKHLQ